MNQVNRLYVMQAKGEAGKRQRINRKIFRTFHFFSLIICVIIES